MAHPSTFDHSRLRVFPLHQRRSLTRADDVVVDPTTEPTPISERNRLILAKCASRIRAARDAKATVMLIYGAHLLRNGAALILDQLMDRGWVSHLATNGAGTIHDWEYAWLGQSTESVRDNVATGTFGTWDETGRNIHLALLAGGIHNEGYGTALGRFIEENGVQLPEPEVLEEQIASEPGHPLTGARAELLQAMRRFGVNHSRIQVEHRWKHASILASAFRHQTGMTVHPGIGYDIISCHPMFNGAAIGRAAETDFKSFCASVENLDNGVVLSVGSAIMGPQVFEKSISCVNNIRIQESRPIVRGHSIYVVDLQDGGNWDWSNGEPPKTNPAYYLRFCKSFSRMGGDMQYLQCDNLSFVHHLLLELQRS